MQEINESKPDESELARQNKPGALRSTVTMEIQTILAQRLMQGRKRAEGVEPIIGALEFGRRMGAMWTAAQADDPYADWFLIRIQQAIEAARKTIDGHAKRIAEALEHMEGLTIGIASSIAPLQIPLEFGNPYGYMAAYLVGDYDSLCRKYLTARHLGVIDRNKSEEILQSCGKLARKTFGMVTHWRFTGVSRQDIAQHNQVAQLAKESMGDIPADILSGVLRARIVPEIDKSSDRKRIASEIKDKTPDQKPKLKRKPKRKPKAKQKPKPNNPSDRADSEKQTSEPQS